MFRRSKGDQNQSATAAAGAEKLLPPAQWRSFVGAAYRGILGRAVDEAGLEHCLARLEQGWTATELLQELTGSEECRHRLLDFATVASAGPQAGLSADFALLSDSLQHASAVEPARFERAWQGLADYSAQVVVGQAEYCEQHKQRFFELVNAVALLTRGKHNPRLLEIGVSACSNLYAQLFPEICLELADRPTADDYPGFTRGRCEAIQACQAFYPLDLTAPDALAAGRLPGMADYDLILLTEVLPVLCVNPQELFSGLLKRLAPGGYLYITAANFLSAAARATLAAGLNPSPLYPPGQENWDRHHAFRHYTGKELLSLIHGAGGETCGFYYSASLDGDTAPVANDQRGTLVAVARRLQAAPAPVAETEQEVVIHIGSDKAGSTAIQAHVYGNRYWLRNQGIYVPDCFLGKDNGHADLLEELTAAKLETLLAEITDPGRCYRTVFLSWEGAHFLGERELRLLAQHLSPRPVRIIFYLREQAEVIQSGLLQEIKTQRRKLRLGEEALAPGAPDNRDYYQTLKRWERSFPRLAAEVVYYDRSAFPDGDVVRDLLQRLGCENLERFNFYDRDINTSLDVAGTLAIEEKLAQTPMQGLDARFFIDSVLLHQKLRGAGERYFLNREQVNKLRAHYQPSNQLLVDEYQVSPKLLSDSQAAYVAGEEHFARDIDQQVAAVLRGVDELSLHPVSFAGLTRGSALQVFLAEGWSQLDQDGYWNDSATSVVRLRPLMSSLAPCHRWLVIEIQGVYHPTAPLTTAVSINGESLGDYRLAEEELCLPLQQLPADLHVDLQLDFGAAAVPGQPVFRLDALGIQLREVL
ncbi:MAG: hypothetical protein O7F73_20045 [Gammaproteobacteria bacterium]|nr:hypothetical protein [Gammaproteobacteria bacterium]